MCYLMLSRTLIIVMIFHCQIERTKVCCLPTDFNSNINLSKYLKNVILI